MQETIVITLIIIGVGTPILVAFLENRDEKRKMRDWQKKHNATPWQ